MTRTPSLVIPTLQTTPPWTRFTALLYGILPGHGLNIHYIYVYVTGNSAIFEITASTISASRSLSRTRNLSYAIAVIGISFLRFSQSPSLIQLRFSNPIQLILPDSIGLRFHDSVWLLLRKNIYWFESQLSHTPGSTTWSIVSWKYFNSEIAEYYRILKTQIGFVKDTIFFSLSEKRRNTKNPLPPSSANFQRLKKTDLLIVIIRE